MINQDRVRQMSRLAMLESDIGKNAIKVCSYRKADYVIMQIIKGFIAGTICFAALFLLWICFRWDDLNLFFSDAQFEDFFVQVLKGYGVFLAAYLVICGFVAVKIYNKCRKQKSLYLKYLNGLNKSYISENDAEEDEED